MAHPGLRWQTAGSIAPSEWDYRTAKEIAGALQARKISAVELTDHVIARIEALDQKINAVVVRDFDRARDAAKAADAALGRGERRPLLGVPITIKESFNVAGLPTTWGIVAAKGFVPQEDALTVARLKGAGAVVLGKTNVPLMLADWQSFNAIYGTTNNPWDLARTPGGSSGGSAAALAAGFGPLSLGSDIGGSLRVPPNYCGVYGHKPTHGIIPTRGHAPPGARAVPRDIDLAVVGPMARSASDIALELDILAGPDELRDAVAYRLALPPPRHEALKDFRCASSGRRHGIRSCRRGRRCARRCGKIVETGSGKAGVRGRARESPLLPDFAEERRGSTCGCCCRPSPRPGRLSNTTRSKPQPPRSRRTTTASPPSVCAARRSAIATGWRRTRRGPGCASAGADCLLNGMP